MSVDITDQGYTVIVEEESNEVTVVAPGAAGALGYYGSFFSDQDQQAVAINTATAMTLNNTAEANGVSITSGSRVTFAYDGTYDLQFSAQLHHRGGGGNGTEIDIWLAKNGSPVADSATKLVIDKNKYEVAAWDFLLTVAAGDYLELIYRVTNTDIVLEHGVADGVPVDTPSLIVTVMQVMYNQVGPVGPQGPTGPQGAKGDKGDTGATGSAATIAVGTTSTLAPGASATVTNSGTSSAAVFDFGIPEGDKGDKGDTGDTGPQGPQGPSGVISVTAPITNTGTSTSALLGLSTGTGLSTAGGVLAADFGATSTTVASGDRGLPTGGGTGQVLAKQSGSNYDTQWVTPTTDAPVSASYVTLGTDGTLTSERVLTAGTGISVTDAGAGSTVTVATSAILPTVVDAKGDLIAATANDAVTRLGVGANDTVLMAASGETTGLVWRSPRLAGGAARPLLTGGAYLDGTTGLVLSGLSGNYASAPDSAALSITGDIDIKVKVTMADWTPSNFPCLVGKWATASGKSYRLIILTGGDLRLTTSTNGTDEVSGDSSVTTGFADGSTKWIRATLDVNNGSSQRVYKFYTSDNGTTWTQLGTTVTSAGTTSIFDSTSILEIGSQLTGSQALVNGTIHRTIIQSAFDTADNTTSVVFDANFETQTADALAFTESSTNAATVTINTTRYTYGYPGSAFISTGTDGLSTNTDFFHFFYVTSPIIVDMVIQEVTSAPASTATAYFGIYAADNNFTPSGGPLVNETMTIATSTTGIYVKQFTGVTLQPGAYVSVSNTNVTYTVRTPLLASQFVRGAMGTSTFLGASSRARTAATYPNPLTTFTTFAGSGASTRVYSIYRWRAA